MKKSSTSQPYFYTVSAICALLVFMPAILSIIGCNSTKNHENKEYINYISFSHDGKRILFDRRKDGEPYLINVYDLGTGELSAYQPPINERWTMARYSYDGKYIVFSIIPQDINKNLELGKMQIAIMNPDGNNIKKITKSWGPKIYPSFSHSGENVIYAKAGAVRNKGRTPAADYDIYEVDIKNGNETRLTWLGVFIIFPPYLLPDDETIIFGAYGPPDMAKFNYEEVNNYIYIIKKGTKRLPEPLVFLNEKSPLISTVSGPDDPLISQDGKHVYFKALAKNPDGIHGEGDQYYEYSKDGGHRRITNNPRFIRFTRILSAALSPDNQYLATICDTKGEKTIVICNVNDSTCKTIFLPDYPSYIINQTVEEKAEQINPADPVQAPGS